MGHKAKPFAERAKAESNRAAKSKKPTPPSAPGRRKIAPVELRKLRAEVADTFDRAVADKLPELLENLMLLARGGYEIGEETWEHEPTLELVPKGRKRAPKTLSLVKQTRKIAHPDRAACEYLIDRVLGRSKQSVDLSGTVGLAVPPDLERLIADRYGDKANAASAD